MSRMKKHYIAYFDILGYKAFFADTNNDIEDFLQSNIDISKDSFRKTVKQPIFDDVNFKIKSFSDNFIILIEAKKQSDGYQEVKALGYLIALLQLRFLERYGILIRGAITQGDSYIDNKIVFGEGLIRAVELEERAKFSRVILDKERFDEKVCCDLCEKCISKDEDREYYVNPYSVLGIGVGESDEFIDNEDKHIRLIRENIIKNVEKYGKYPRVATDSRTIKQTEKTIEKYTWLLEKFNQYVCMDDLVISYNKPLYKPLMKHEIEVLE